MKFHPETSVKSACLLALASAALTSATAVSLPVTYYDFLGENSPPTMGRTVHPDFKLMARSAPTTGLVQSLVGPTGPLFLSALGVPPNAARPQLTTAPNLSMWYTSVPAFNVVIPSSLTAITLPSGQRQFNYPSNFFPIDGQGLGNYGATGHNYHFTMSYSQAFTYDSSKANLFDFAADDDLYIFINGKLWVEIGGIHPVGTTKTYNLNTAAPSLGLVDGGVYQYQLFFAERHTFQSALIATLPAPVPEANAFAPALALGGVAGLMAIRRRKARTA
jgi:fibro-slime domain-containing protein